MNRSIHSQVGSGGNILNAPQFSLRPSIPDLLPRPRPRTSDPTPWSVLQLLKMELPPCISPHPLCVCLNRWFENIRCASTTAACDSIYTASVLMRWSILALTHDPCLPTTTSPANVVLSMYFLNEVRIEAFTCISLNMLTT